MIARRSDLLPGMAYFP